MDSTTITNQPNEISSDYISVLGICGLVGYGTEIDHCIGLCQDARHDYNLLQTISKIHPSLPPPHPVSSTSSSSSSSSSIIPYRRRYRIQYAVMHADYVWFRSLFKVSNHNDLVQLRTPYNETLYHLLCGVCTPIAAEGTMNNDPYFFVPREDTFTKEIRYIPHPHRNPGEQTNVLQILALLLTIKLDINCPMGNCSPGNERERMYISLGTTTTINTNYHHYHPTTLSVRKQLPTEDLKNFTFLMLTILCDIRFLFDELINHSLDRLRLDNHSSSSPPLPLPSSLHSSYPHTLLPNNLSVTDDFRGVVPYFYRGSTPLHLAYALEDMYYIQILSQLPNINYKVLDGNLDTPLHLAVRNAERGIKTIEQLLKYNEAVMTLNQPNREGLTPLGLACIEERVDIVSLLCSIPTVDLNVIDNNNFTPLTLAVAKGATLIVQALLRYSQRINLNYQGTTALPLY